MLIGRALERDRLREFLDPSRLQGCALLVRGEAGVGKSALLDHAKASASAMRVVEAVGVESESTLPFAALATIAAPLVDHLARLPERQRRALVGALALGPPADGDRLAVAAATFGLVTLAAEERPLLVVIDDAQWVDEPSREVLLFAARRLRHEPVRLLLASRDDEAASLAGVGVPELVVGPLSPEDSVRLLMGTSDVSPAVAAVIEAATGGNPLALLAVPATLTVDQRVGRAALEDPLPVGSALAVFGRLAQALPRAGQRALLVACADGSGRLSPLLSAFDHLRLPRDALDAAERAHLVRTIGDRITVRHPLTRSAVYHGADVAERRTAHRALAVAYEGRDPDRYAWHLGRAAHGEDERAAAALEDAASRAARRQGYAAAVDAYSLAAGLSPRAGDRARRLVSAARAAELAGLPERMLALTREAAAVTEDVRVLADLALLVGRAERDRDPAVALAALDRAATSVADADPARESALLEEAAVAATRVDAELAVEFAARAVSAARRAGLGTAMLETSHARLLHFAGRPQAQSNVVVLPDVGDLEDARAALWVVAAHPVPDRSQQAVVEKVIALARDRGALGLLPEALVVAGGNEFYLGDWTTAVADDEEAIELAMAVGRPAVACEAYGNLARVNAFRGREARSREQLETYLRMTRSLGLLEDADFAGVYRGELALTRGEPDEAIRCLAPTRYARTISRAHAGLVEAYARVGRTGEARRSLDDLVRLVQETDSMSGRLFVARLEGLLASGSEEAFAWFEEAVRHADFLAWPLESARTELMFGERLRRDRRRREARPHLSRAVEIFDSLGAEPWAERARSELAATGERARPRTFRATEELTPQELQLARIVAQGASNREAAERLFVSRKTVEAHLGAIYRKLGLRSRTELAARLHADAVS
jgi:DNA-binding CsgD family transcriptional regulator